MDDKELHAIHDIINDTWKYMKAHSKIIDTDEYWSDVIASADALWDKHDRHPLCRALLTDCMKYLERQVHT